MKKIFKEIRKEIAKHTLRDCERIHITIYPKAVCKNSRIGWIVERELKAGYEVIGRKK